MTDQSQPAIEAASALANGIAISAKTTYWSAAVTMLMSWADSVPTGVLFGAGVAVAGYLTGVVFRWCDRRAKQRLEQLEEEFLREADRMRRLEHEAKMRYYQAGRDSEGAPLS